MTIRIPLLSLLGAATLLVISSCQGFSGPPPAASQPAQAASGAPGPGVLHPDETAAAFFHDDVANLDLVQVAAWDDSAHQGVFVTVPASAVAQPGRVTLDPSQPGVNVRYGVDHEGGNDPLTRQWFFSLYSGTLVVTSGGSAVGDSIAVTVTSAVFEFADEHGRMSPAVSAQLKLVSPTINAVLGQDPLCF